MEAILLIIIGGMLLYAVVSIVVQIVSRGKDRKKEIDIQESQNKYALKRKEYESRLSELKDKYGECSTEISLSGWEGYSIQDSFLIFKEAKIVVIENVTYDFQKILGYTLIDDSTERTQTFSNGDSQSSSGSVIARAVVGGIIGGGVGALAGASTAKRNTSSVSITTKTKSDRYVIYINLDSIEMPMVKLKIFDRDNAYRIANILNVIVKRNEQTKA